MHGLTKLSKADFLKVGEAEHWHHFLTANSFLESIISMIKDERLNSKMSLSSFNETID